MKTGRHEHPTVQNNVGNMYEERLVAFHGLDAVRKQPKLFDCAIRLFCGDSIPFRGGAKSEGICLLFKIKGYLCIVVGNRPRETLQNGAVFRWSNRGR
ncbi:hypothetical protein [Alistipes sp. An31A]|uniref:hypothetical protein n=1 Tax=Alistipes sp. An31A TaxID=1965631 RepID=UPI0011784BEA|nr:hypothetical protein [Alistipes sp. An31A]